MKTREGLLIVVAAAAVIALLAPAPALAGENPPKPPDTTGGPVPTPPSPLPPEQPPAPQAKLELKLKGEKKGRVRVGRRVKVLGTLGPWRPGQQVTVSLLRGGSKVVKKEVVPVTHGGGDAGQFRLKGPTLLEPGHYVATAEHAGNPVLGPARARSTKFKLKYPGLNPGDGGKEVKLFNRLLDKEGYVPSKGKRFTDRTGRAVLAYRKVHGMARTTRATSGIFKTLADGRGAYKLKHPGAGKHVEVNIGRQVMVLADNGKAQRTYHVSTGASSTPTIRGHYRFYRRQPGFNAIGMYYSVYFRGGYAIHGYRSVPTRPASHGCVRTPIADARSIYNWVQLGMSIYTY